MSPCTRFSFFFVLMDQSKVGGPRGPTHLCPPRVPGAPWGAKVCLPQLAQGEGHLELVGWAGTAHCMHAIHMLA